MSGWSGCSSASRKPAPATPGATYATNSTACTWSPAPPPTAASPNARPSPATRRPSSPRSTCPSPQIPRLHTRHRRRRRRLTNPPGSTACSNTTQIGSSHVCAGQRRNSAIRVPTICGSQVSILQRKALFPDDFTDLGEVTARLAQFETRYTRPPARSNGSSPPPTWPNSWPGSTTTNPPNPEQHDPRRTYEPDHGELDAGHGGPPLPVRHMSN